ncbi:conserved hypothetical protein [Pediculus humanus corporis]|uniref:Uncharacterized protein n=1 Tax=Pediculus humanus subsp. corporis TaxID=121224 RepID=E0VHD1_PEDHC|nr:uncharacterized protein Phum_PHUM205460 [Pediculus humanus corporis]EEB12787.1 conserved hypothetical protein [Pediculus humanus corporis]
MEISATLKSDIKNILALKLKEYPDLESQIKQDLCGIQKHIIELNDRQKLLLQQFRKEIEENINNNQFVPVFNFNLYKIKPGQLESKKRRRKDLSLAPKVISCRPTHSPPSLSPSPTPSSSSSLSDDSVEYISPFMLPVPVPKARPMLLPDVKENVYLGSVSRDLRPPKLKRNQKPLSDEEVFKDIPVYYDPLPSPPPTDEKDLKARKVERKRRSTATNNPNFVYNNDWEIPAWKRSRTYLSPHKIAKVETLGKKMKAEDGGDGGLPIKQSKKDRNFDYEKSGKIYSEGMLNVCKDCSVSYHLSCVSPNSSSISCPCCKHKRSPDEASSEESSKEEFVSKCPNVAEKRENFKIELMAKNQELYSQKRELEEKAAELSEALLLQEDTKSNLLKEEEKILKKIKIIIDFVTRYQKGNEKKESTSVKEEKISENNEMQVSDNVENPKIVVKEEEEEEEEGEEKVEDVNKEKNNDEINENNEKTREGNCESPVSWKENEDNNSQANYFSPERFSHENMGGFSPKGYDNCDSSSQMSKESLVNDNSNARIVGSPPNSSKDSVGNALFELDEGDDQFTSQSVECSAESEGVDYESSLE